jgi:GR25 family glycosyltransferase involved in LPS biosynthesis
MVYFVKPPILKKDKQYVLSYINLSDNTRRNKQFQKYAKETVDMISELSGPVRINAIDGRNISLLQQYAPWYDPKTYIGTPSELACTLSHLTAIKYAYDHNIDYAIICEDDVDIRPLGTFWDFYFKGAVLQSWNGNILQLIINDNCNIYRSNCVPIIPWKKKHYGTGMYLINREGMGHVLSMINTEKKPFQLKHFQIKDNFTSDNIIYEYAKNTYSSMYPFCTFFEHTTSIKTPNHEGSIRVQRHINCTKISDGVLNQMHERLNYIQKLSRHVPSSPNKKLLMITSAGDHSNFVQRGWIHQNYDWMDLIIVYYGDDDDIFHTYKSITPYVLRNKGFQYQNTLFAYYTYKEHIDSTNYAYIFVSDDDLIFTVPNTHEPSWKALRKILQTCQQYKPDIAHVSCALLNNENVHQVSWWREQTGNRLKDDTPYHISNFVEMNNLCFSKHIFVYMMKLIPYKNEILSWGFDHLIVYLYKQLTNSDMLVLDTVQYYNLSTRMKGLKDRIIDTNAPTRKSRWDLYKYTFLKHYLLPTTTPSNIPLKPKQLFLSYQYTGPNRYQDKVDEWMNLYFPSLEKCTTTITTTNNNNKSLTIQYNDEHHTTNSNHIFPISIHELNQVTLYPFKHTLCHLGVCLNLIPK